MNKALYLTMLKREGKKAAFYSAGLALYNAFLIGIYPYLTRTEGMKEVSVNLPASVRRVFGMSDKDDLATFESYVATQCFGQVWAFSMAAFAISSAYRLVGELINQGSMAYLLATPLGRKKIIFNQWLVMITALMLCISLIIVSACLCARTAGIEIKALRFISLGIGMYTLVLGIESYAFALSVFYLEGDKALFAAVTITALFYMLNILSGLNDKLDGLKKLSFFNWLSPQQFLEGAFPYKAVIASISLIFSLFKLSQWAFVQRDLDV